MIEIVESGWGDWWILRDCRAVAVHLFEGSSERTLRSATEHAARLGGAAPPSVRPLRDGRRECDQLETTR